MFLYINDLISSATACGPQMQAQYSKGDNQFGGIDFYCKRGDAYGLVLDHCSWNGHGEDGSKYLLEFQHIDTGM